MVQAHRSAPVFCSDRPSRDQLTKLELKRLQHVFTDWFPGVVFNDLTDDTVRVDVVARKGNLSGQSVYNTSFLKADGSVIKVAYYDEDRSE